jgi:hypothetical protein
MDFPARPFDNDLLGHIDSFRNTGTKDDNHVLQVLQSLSAICTSSKDSEPENVLFVDGANPHKNVLDRLFVQAVPTMRQFAMAANETVDDDQINKLDEDNGNAYQDEQLATTLLAFANDLGIEYAGNEGLETAMRELHQLAVPMIVAE